MTRTIYRLEQECGYGMYRMSCSGGIGIDAVQNVTGVELRYSEHTPMPDHEGIELHTLFNKYDGEDNTIFGFTSIKQMKNWVQSSNVFHVLMERGLKLAKYVVPKEYVEAAPKQCVFAKQRATFVAYVNPKRLADW